MSSTVADSRVDRLYQLLPAIYRMRDGEQQYPLQALLRVIAEQVNIVEDDIEQLYDNWFIETADDWAVPYIADLIGYRPVSAAGMAGDVQRAEGRALNRILVPRREVANTIRYRRRKGTLALLEQLAHDVAGWRARAVEFFTLLGWQQNLNHQHPHRARTVDVRDMDALDLIDGPFDRSAHTVDVRRMTSHRTRGRLNIPSVGVFVWRLKSYAVTHTPAYCAEEAGPHCFTFSVLGQDAPLFIKPALENEPTHIAEEVNLPVALRRRAFAEDRALFYGATKSFAIWADGWIDAASKNPVPIDALIPADLSDWQYVPPHKRIAVDPVLGRLAFPPSQLPKKGVRVSYHYGFSADMGGGEYERLLLHPPTRIAEITDPASPSQPLKMCVDATVYPVGEGHTFQRIGQALALWTKDQPRDAIIELMDSGAYVEPIVITMQRDQTLQLRAANGVRPVIRLLDWQTDLPDALSIAMAPGSRFTLDGLLVTGRSVRITGANDEHGEQPHRSCGSEVIIRHSTLVPGWSLECDCEPKRSAEPSLELYNVRAALRIEHSIVGSIQIHEDEVRSDPIAVRISDSILDATDPAREAIGAPGYPVAHAVATILRSTVFGIVDVHAVALAENSIFNDCVNVARRQIGCMRFCYVPPGCRTPRRYHCQPDLVEGVVRAQITDLDQQKAMMAAEQRRLRPQFTSTRYGTPGYAQLGEYCAAEIVRGADDESEMGAFHDLFQPQRAANLQARLTEYTPAGMDVGILYAT